MPGCQKLQMTLNPVWHRMHNSCTHMATVAHCDSGRSQWASKG